QGSRPSTNRIFLWPITLLGGTNAVLAVGTKGSSNVNDSLVWNAPIPPPQAAITSPSAAIVFLLSTNDTLQLTATASDSQPNAPPLTTTWRQLSGPGLVNFADSNALATTARFTADGIYGLRFSASNGATTSVGLTVVVNPTIGVPNGLLAWWKMDEAGGATAADSSG